MEDGRRTIENVSIATSPGKTDMGAAIVLAHVSAKDIYDIPHVAYILTLSPEEARSLAEQLINSAKKAEEL